MVNGTNLSEASMQWASRPDDQRYLSMADLKAAVMRRKTESWTATPRLADLRMIPDQENGLAVQLYDPSQGEQRMVKPSHWGFGQLSQYAQAPAGYLRKLPAELAAINLQYGLERSPLRDDALVLCQSNGDNVMRAVTSASYEPQAGDDAVRQRSGRVHLPRGPSPSDRSCRRHAVPRLLLLEQRGRGQCFRDHDVPLPLRLRQGQRSRRSPHEYRLRHHTVRGTIRGGKDRGYGEVVKSDCRGQAQGAWLEPLRSGQGV